MNSRALAELRMFALWVSGGAAGWSLAAAAYDAPGTPVPLVVAVVCFVLVAVTRPR
jgi:hypothetical protein